MPPSAPLPLLGVCTELRARTTQRSMLLKQGLVKLLPPTAEIQKPCLWLPSSGLARPSRCVITA